MKTKSEYDRFSDSLDFVVKHYQEDAFIPPKMPWSNAGTRRLSWLRRNAVAAAITGAIITATACTIYFTTRPTSSPAPSTPLPADIIETTSQPLTTDTVINRRIEFNNATIREIVGEIEQTYNVKIENVPETDQRLTISYEGTAEDLVATINALLDENMTIHK